MGCFAGIWPFSEVQDWFEGLWNWVGQAAVNAVSAVWEWITDAISGLWTSITGAFGSLWTGIVDAFGGIWTGIVDAFGNLWTGMVDMIGGLWVSLTTWFGDFWVNLVDVLGNLWTGMVDMIGDLWLNITTAFDGAVAGISTIFTGFWEAICDVVGTVWTSFTDTIYNFWTSITDFFNTLWTNFQAWFLNTVDYVKVKIVDAITDFIVWFQWKWTELIGWLVQGIRWVGAKLQSFFEGLVTMIFEPIIAALMPGSPPEPLGAITAEFGTTIMNNIVAEAKKIHESPAQREKAVAAGAAVLGGITLMQSVGGALTMAFDATHPVKTWGTADMFHRVVLNLMSSPVTSAILATPVIIGIITPMRQYFNAMFRPEIPGAGDLIRFVVREVIPPAIFSEYMGYHGYSETISTWYWDAHWVLPAFTQLVDAFHRGIITDGELNTFIVWHDYSPTARPGIGKSDVEIMRGLLKRLIPRVDLRYAWEMGKITDEELEDRYIRLGYEEDAALMTEIQMARALVEEVHKVRDEWIRDFLEGYILEGTLRANLAAIGISPLRIDYYVEYARMRREREYKADLLDAYWDGYLKDLITYEELATHAGEIIVDGPARDLWLEKVYIRKYKKPKAD